MKRFVLAVAAVFALLIAQSAHSPSQAASPNAGADRPVCPGPAAADSARCHARVVSDGATPNATAAPSGLIPSQITKAYGFSSLLTAGAGTTIAIVDAYDNPNAKADLDSFSAQFNLPTLPTCSGSLPAATTVPCFQKVNQTGGTNYPRADQGWALEIALDIQWAHAIAPGASILLVEARSNSFTNLLTAEDYAKGHAQYVSNSWGGSESSGETGYDSHFFRSGVSVFVSSGDSGLPAQYPSSSPNVISVGGTTLTLNADGSIANETGWSSGGGGCSLYEAATAAQASFVTYGQVQCGGKRATPDVSLDADPASGVSVLDTYGYQGQSGWFTVGGTSASSPMVAAHYAVLGVVADAAAIYGSTLTFRDITSGNNGAPCLPSYDLCSGVGSAR